MRGKDRTDLRRIRIRRITPAYAGKSNFEIRKNVLK